MATWVTHLIIADKVMNIIPELDIHGFCVGNIAPDCNGICRRLGFSKDIVPLWREDEGNICNGSGISE